jgi:hypothetical protein
VVPTTGLESINSLFSPLPVVASSGMFIAHTVTNKTNIYKHYMSFNGQDWVKILVQMVCNFDSCANRVQTQSTQNLCKLVQKFWPVFASGSMVGLGVEGWN